jgi:NTE family protein
MGRQGLVKVLAGLVCAMWTFSAAVAGDTAGSLPEGRPRIGLVLGGGGAKGAAHIGILELLEEMRVPVDCIAGTSMGALIGATYAAGMRPGEIEQAVRAIDWAQTLGSQDLRDRMPIERKLAAANYSNNLDIGWRGGKLRGRGGLISTQNVEGLLTELVASAQFTEDFDDLPIPFRAVATDMLKGQMVVLGEGDLALAMRASMAIPGAFTPVHTDGRVLADGGMMRNLPVDVARDLCADVVIAVWLASPDPDADAFGSTLGMINRALDVMVATNQNAQIDSLTDADIGVEVPMGDIGPADFTRVGEAIDRGIAAAESYRKAFARYSLPEAEYADWLRRVHGVSDGRYRVQEVRVAGLDRVNPDYVASQLVEAQPGATINVENIVADMERVYALGDFERVEYHLLGSDDARILELRPVEKSWGPNFLGFDYGIETSDGADLNAILRADHERTWLNRRGGRWHSALQLGRQSLLETDFYQPLDVPQRFFLQPLLRAQTSLEDLYLDGDRFVVYDIQELFGQLDLGMNMGTRAQLRLGLRHGWQSAKLETGIPGLPELSREKDTSLQLRVTYDTRDVKSLPTRGAFFGARYSHSQDWFGSKLDYSVLESVMSQAFNLNGNSLSLILGGAKTISGETPTSQLIELGGIRTFPGLRPGELRGSDYWFAGTSYLWRLTDLQPIFGQSLYAGFRLQAGQMRDKLNDTDTGTLYGVSGSLSGRTPIGPFMLSLGYVLDNDLRLQFMLGRPVPEGSLFDELH